MSRLKRFFAGDGSGAPGPALPILFYSAIAVLFWLGYHHRIPSAVVHVGLLIGSVVLWAFGGAGVALLVLGVPYARNCSRGEWVSPLILIPGVGMGFCAGAAVGITIAVVHAL